MNISLWTKGAMKIALFSAVFALSGAGVAVAGTGTTGGAGSIGNNQTVAPSSNSMTSCGDPLAAILGSADPACADGTSTAFADGPAASQSDRWSTSNNAAALPSSNHAYMPAGGSGDTCGNRYAALGRASAPCHGGEKVTNGYDNGAQKGHSCCQGGTSDAGGIKVEIKVGICDSSVAVLAPTTGDCQGGSVSGPLPHHGCPPSGSRLGCPPPHQGCPSQWSKSSLFPTLPTWQKQCCPPSGSRLGCPPPHQGCPSQWVKSSLFPTLSSWQKQCCPPSPGFSPSKGLPSAQRGLSPSKGLPSAQRGLSPSKGLPSAQRGLSPLQGCPKPAAPLSAPGVLPTTGADLAGLVTVGLGAIVAGAVSLVMMRRRRVTGRI
jgi:LPXTG-motif cell wall-anchored protein